MTKPLTNRQITNRWVKALIDKDPVQEIGLPDMVGDLRLALIEQFPRLTSKDRHSIIINTITRYVRYLLEQEDKSNE